MTTRHELISTINALHELRAEDQALIAQLQARLDLVAATCAYCGTTFWNDDPAALDHWRTCEKHPALSAVRQLQDEVETLRAQMNRRVTL